MASPNLKSENSSSSSITTTTTLISSKSDFSTDSLTCSTQSIYDKGCSHSFVPSTFTNFTYCNFCGSLIWGIIRQGLKCKSIFFLTFGIDCYKALHYQCLSSYMNSIDSDEDVSITSQINQSKNLEPLSLDETLNWVEQIFRKKSIFLIP